MTFNYILLVPLLVFAWYFIFMELKQLWKSGFDYFLSFWNYLDIVPPLLLNIFIILELNGKFDLVDSGETKTLEDGTIVKIIHMQN